MEVTSVKRLTAVAAAVLVASLFFIATTSAATVKTTYQANYGSRGTITVRQFTDGTGSANIHMSALTSGRTYSFSLARGRCTGSITLLMPAKTIKVSSAGTLGKTWPLSSAQMRTITPRLSTANAVAILTSGTSRLCRTLYALSAIAPTPTPGASPSANVSTHNAGFGPTLTPATMSDWFAALKAGVPASATATVEPGQNVYALLVIPAGGSIAFKVTTGSGGWYWQWNAVSSAWQTPAQYFSDGDSFARTSGTWAFGLDSNTYAGSETLTITPTAITRP
jgi:hypothetical protein